MFAWMIASLALLIATVALIVTWRTFTRYKHLAQRVEQMTGGGASFKDTFDGAQLSLDAMLTQLETKGQELIQSIESAAATKALRLGKPEPLALVQDDLGPEDKKRLVRQLFRQGLDPITIARRLGLGHGEVQLIIDLPET